MSSVFARLGKKHLELAGRWMGTSGAYGALAGVGLLYATDWKLILQFLPYYNGKYAEDQ